MAFKKATKEQSRLRCAIFGPSGSGKTFTALRLASGMAAATKSSIALIDTEYGSASLYADRFAFDVCDLTDQTIDGYIAQIQEAAKAGYGILVIDSMTHGWQELLEEIDKLTKTKYKGNSFQAWAEGTPKQKRFIRALLEYPGHIIASMRSKTEWTMEKDERTGKLSPKRVGLAPEEGKGIEYEFPLLLEMNPDHYCTVIKDRTGKYQDKIIEKPTEDFGRDLIAWLSEGAVPEERKPEPPKTGEPQNGDRAKLIEIGKMLKAMHNGDTSAMQNALMAMAGVASLADLPHDKIEKVFNETRGDYESWQNFQLTPQE